MVATGNDSGDCWQTLSAKCGTDAHSDAKRPLIPI